MTQILNNKPIIGTVSGVGSGVLYATKALFTDDLVLKYVSGAGMLIGTLVAILTLYLRIVEIIKINKSK